MIYLFGQLWLYVVLALILGMAFGWWAALSSRELHRPVIMTGAAVLIAGGLLAYTQVMRGKAGLWWDIWMLLVLAYIVGCLIAWLLGMVLGTSTTAAAPLAAPMPMPAAKPMAAPVMAATLAMAATPGPVGVATGMAAKPAPAGGMAPPSGATPFPTAPVLFSNPGTEMAGEKGQGKAVIAVAPPASATPAAMAPTPAPAAIMMPPPAPDSADAGDEFDDTDESIIAARPPGLPAPNGGKKDDLKRISGIGRVNEGKLNELGIFHFSQIGAWTPAHAKWVNSHLSFPGRIQRERWISQSKQLAAGGDTEFSKRVKAGKVPTSS